MRAGVGNRVSTTSGRWRRRTDTPSVSPGVRGAGRRRGRPDPGPMARSPRPPARAALVSPWPAMQRYVSMGTPAAAVSSDVMPPAFWITTSTADTSAGMSSTQPSPTCRAARAPGRGAGRWCRTARPASPPPWPDVPRRLEQPPIPHDPPVIRRAAHARAARARAVPATRPGSCATGPNAVPTAGGRRSPTSRRSASASRAGSVVDGQVLVDTGVHPEPVDGHVGEVGRHRRLAAGRLPQAAERLAGEGVRRDDASGPSAAISSRPPRSCSRALPMPRRRARGARRRAASSAMSPAPTGPAGGSRPHGPAEAPGIRSTTSQVRVGKPRAWSRCAIAARPRRGRRRSSRRRCPPARQGLVGRRCCSGCSCRSSFDRLAGDGSREVWADLRART